MIGVGLKSDDASGDGITNFENYAFGFDPTRNNSNRVPAALTENGSLVMTYRRAKYAADVQYDIEESVDSAPFSVIPSPDQMIVGEDSGAFLVEFRVPIVGDIMLLRVLVIDLAP